MSPTTTQTGAKDDWSVWKAVRPIRGWTAIGGLNAYEVQIFDAT